MNGWLQPAAALFLILVAVEFFLPLRSLGSAFHVAMNGASAGKKIISLLNMPDPVWGSEEAEGTELRLNGVTFSYDGKRDVLRDVSMTFPARGMTAIVGRSGCGKSTVVNLLIGAYRPKAGSVTIGGKPLESVSRQSYYSRLACVSYNTYLFNDSVRANFALAKQDVKDEEIWAALEKVNLSEFVKENGGLDKVITEDANNISGGQKQRLALAVNLVANKGIYVFDEATSNIDIESEAIIMRNVKAMSETKSVIVISHRLANVVPADSIYYMEEGEVKEHGAHGELMAQKGGYQTLFEAQKLFQALFWLFVEGDAEIGVLHIVIGGAEVLLDTLPFRLIEEPRGALRRDAARGRAEKGQGDIFRAFEPGIGVFGALGVRPQVDDGADVLLFKRLFRRLGEVREPAAPKELPEGDGAAVRGGDAAEIARVIEFAKFQPLHIHTLTLYYKTHPLVKGRRMRFSKKNLEFTWCRRGGRPHRRARGGCSRSR